jgi:type I restriction enzyme, S subunit
MERMTKELGSVCNFISGHAWKADQFKDNGIMPIIRIQNLGINDNSKFVYWDGKYDQKFVVNKGDYLLSLSGSIKVDKWEGPSALLNQRIVKIVTINNTHDRWLFWQLSKVINEITRLGKWALVNNVSITDLREFKILVPPVEVQQRIATILDHADSIRRKNKEILEKYNQLEQSVFHEMFGDLKLNQKDWNTVKLHSVCTHIIDCPHSTPKHQSIPTDYPCIRTSEIKGGKIDWRSMLYLSYENYLERIKRFKPIPGDIVYGREGSFGDAAIIPQSINLALGQRVMLFRVDKSIINNVFFWAQIRSSFVFRQAQKLNCGATVGHVNIKDIRNFDLLLPPLNIQNKFALLMGVLYKQIELSLTSLNKSEELFHCLLQRAFKGEL